MDIENKTYSFSIVSGKGGVGKTNLALNLGYALHTLGRSAVLMDCDLGLANLDVLLGISPEHNIQDLLESDIDPQSVVVSIDGSGLDLLPAASGVADLIELDEDVQAMLFEKLDGLFHSYDYLLLDLGAGISPSVLSFAAMPQERIVVITPEPTALTDSYALIKVLLSQHGIKNFQVVVNMVSSEKEGRISFERLKMACEKFLNLPISFLGSVRQDSLLIESVRRQTPLFKINPNTPACQDIMQIARKMDKRKTALAHLIKKSPILSPLTT